MNPDVIDIILQFQISGVPELAKRFGNGHINDTYRIINQDNEQPDYLLQRINDHVFRDIEGVMANISGVTDHIAHELANLGYSDVHQRVIQPIRTKSNKTYIEVDGSYWRLYRFMKGLRAYDVAETTEQVYEGGKAFGQFLKLLSNYPAEKLVTTIPDFHNVLVRLDQLKTALDNSENSNDPEVSQLAKFIFDVSGELSEIEKLKQLRRIPIRVTHNDTKFNNVLLDQNDHAMCVIDLDTVMPGVVHYDFGDGIRTGAATAEEDERDLQRVDLDIGKFEAFTAGYLEMCQDSLSNLEIQYLPLSSALLSYLMCIRFLTDHLTGNNYYKVNYPLHNLVRAQNQGHLTGVIMKRIKDLNKVIAKNSSVA